MNSTANRTGTQYLDRGEGRLAYELAGDGPLVVTSPGMGDLRSSFRFVSPELVRAGYRVADADLRGHGDSDASFSEYGDLPTVSDLITLVEKLGAPAVLVGNSLSAAAAIIVAAQRPELVTALVLLGPFAREPKTGWFGRTLQRVATAAPWVAATWHSYLPGLFVGRKPADFAEYHAAVRDSMRKPGYASAFSKTTRTSHAPAEEALPFVKAPTLVLMGESDPDFPDPAAEAAWIGERLGAKVVIVPEAGHYPQAQRPDIVNPAIVDFLREHGVYGQPAARDTDA